MYLLIARNAWMTLSRWQPLAVEACGGDGPRIEGEEIRGGEGTRGNIVLSPVLCA